MVIYLDSATNRKAQPNENFAREVMELFTLGEGHYDERDIREAARAFTGWSIDPDTGEFRWRPFQHDDGVKTVLGRTGNFKGDDVLEILLAQPATAQFVTAKLWREFVSPAPANDAERREQAQVAARFRSSGYDAKVVLRALFSTQAFWAAENRGALVKSPVDFVVGTMRQFEFAVGDPMPLAVVTAQLGQNLFAPPNVKGWPGGEAWINSQTLLARKQFAERIFRADEMPRFAMNELGRPGGAAKAGAEARQRFIRAVYEIRFDSDRWSAGMPGAPSQAEVERLVLARAPVNPIQPDIGTRELVRMLTLDPAYQLK